jgi:putative transposase
VVCEAFKISESCYRYERKLDPDDEASATWQINLTDNNRNWGFGLCYFVLAKPQGIQVESHAVICRF